MIKTLEEYSFAGIQFPERMGPDGLISLEFINRQENLILYGGVGTGKTHLSIALGVKAIENQKVVLFFTVHSLINRLVKAKEDDTYENMKRLLQILSSWMNGDIFPFARMVLGFSLKWSAYAMKGKA